MITEQEKSWNNIMQNVSPADLGVAFDKQEYWDKIACEVVAKKNSTPFHGYLSWQIAASLVVVLAISGFLLLSGGFYAKHSSNKYALLNNWVTMFLPELGARRTISVKKTEINNIASVGQCNPSNGNGSCTVNYLGFSSTVLASDIKQTESIHNATDCTLEICIYQTIKCGNHYEAEVADCSTFQPEESGHLVYQPKKIDDGCNVSVDQIKITKVNTGETITVTSDSGPADAEELLRCFTGESHCSILAGIFEKDCDNVLQPHAINVVNRQDAVIIQ